MQIGLSELAWAGTLIVYGGAFASSSFFLGERAFTTMSES